jgi:hypothetical protein
MISRESAFGFPSMVKATTLSIWFPLLLVDMFLVWLWWCLVMIDQSTRNIKRTDIQNDYTAERVSAMFFRHSSDRGSHVSALPNCEIRRVTRRSIFLGSYR